LDQSIVKRSHRLEQALAEVKVIILGDYGVGKSTFIHLSNEAVLAKKLNKECGCDVLPMAFGTNKCALSFQVSPILCPAVRSPNSTFESVKGTELQFNQSRGAGMGHSRAGSSRWFEAPIFVRFSSVKLPRIVYAGRRTCVIPVCSYFFDTDCSENALGAILMFDVTNKASYRHLEDWYSDLRNVCVAAGKPPVSIVVCGNKADLDGRVVYPRHTVFPKKYGFPYFDVSAKSNFNFESVFLALIRQHLR
jgi:hypothetical protein